MLRVDKSKYAVSGVKLHHLWLEVLTGEDKGIRLSVPRRHEKYSNQLGETVRSLKEGEIVEARLLSDEVPPEWRVDQIRVVESDTHI